MTEENKEILRGLFTDDADVDVNDLFNILAPHVKITKKDHRIIFIDHAETLPLKGKVLLFLLAKKVLFFMQELESDHVSPKTIIEETSIPRGSVLPNLKGLRDDGLVTSENGEYYITPYQITKIKRAKIFNDHDKNK